MKFTLLSTTVFLASLFTRATAQVSLGPFPTEVQVGQTYPLTWDASPKYDYTVWLVLQNPIQNEFAGIKLSIIVTDLHFNSPDGSYVWTVPGNISTQSNHALYLDALAPSDGEYYSNTTNWFKISAADSSSPSTSSTPSSSAHKTPTATASSTPHETSSTSEAPSTEHHSSVSGGTIAGIVIGCLVGIAFVIGGALLYLWRRKRSGVQKREAAARAGRLAPVMEVNAPSYEMHGTPPQEFKSSAAV